MSRIFAGVVLAAVSVAMAGCDEAKQAANELMNEQKMNVRNELQDGVRAKAEEQREKITSDTAKKIKGDDADSDEEEN